jgi:RHS repeat-associated protein
MIDDPLVGIMQSVQQPHRKYYYLTDGGGRLLAFTDSVGTNLLTSDPTYGVNGGYQAGAIDRSTGFDNTRAENSELKGLSYYRNRYYDQATGSFTGEDPIGIAGGMNLYQYAGNNPVVHTDPFGLKVCFARGRRQDLVQATEEATGSRITLDQAGCIDSITSTNTSSQYKELRDRLEALNQELDTYTVAFSGMSSRYEPWARTARISTETPFWYHTTGPTGRCDDFAADNGYAGAVAHELLGHGYGHSLDGFKYLGYLLGGRERAAMKSENLYFRASGSPERCRY